MDPDAFQRRMRAARERRGWRSTKPLADELARMGRRKMGRYKLEDIERGDLDAPDYEIEWIAEALDVDLRWLTDESFDPLAKEQAAEASGGIPGLDTTEPERILGSLGQSQGEQTAESRQTK